MTFSTKLIHIYFHDKLEMSSNSKRRSSGFKSSAQRMDVEQLHQQFRAEANTSHHFAPHEKSV